MNTYINQLPQSTQDLIKKDIIKALISLDITEELDLQDNLYTAMDSRLVDLQDLININPYIKGGN